MTDKTKIVEQTKAAFDFIERLYIETSYLIKSNSIDIPVSGRGFS